MFRLWTSLANIPILKITFFLARNTENNLLSNGRVLCRLIYLKRESIFSSSISPTRDAP